MMGRFISRLFEGILHVDKIHVRFKIANIAHALPVPVHRQTGFQTETGGRFAFTRCRCEILNRSEILAPVQQPGWYHAGVTRAGMTFCSCIMLTLKYRAMRGSRSELAPAWKSPECNVNTTLVSLLAFFDELLLCSAPIIIEDSQRVNRKTKKQTINFYLENNMTLIKMINYID